MIPLDALAHREVALWAARGEPVAYPINLVEVLDMSEQALRRVAAVGWLRTLERLPHLIDR